MNSFIPKNYQQAALDILGDYFRQCRSSGSAAKAFANVASDKFDQSWGYRPLSGFDGGMPYFCLRIPTGGGKTWLAAKSVKLINRHLLRAEHSVILWLTPSNAICEQTLAGLKNREHPLNAALAEAGPVSVHSLDEAKSVTRATLDTSTVVIVSTRQAFQVEKESLRKVYENSGELQHHFMNLPPEASSILMHDIDAEGNDTIPCSLVNVLRMRRPFIIVDEAHNNRTPLAFDTLAKFLPSGIMELTATPDTRGKTPSNVLFSVSASELKNEEMIKLPIILQTVADWRQCLADAIDRREKLQAIVDEAWLPGLERKRPMALIQAEPRSASRETLHCEAIKRELVENQRIPEEEICIATGDTKGLEELAAKYAGGLDDPQCPVKYVITQKALAEGWDCPWAYILVSLANATSAKAVEQLLGRVLRQPDAKRNKNEALNMSYAFAASGSFTATANALRDQLVNVAGFERKDANQFVIPPKPGWLDLFSKKVEIAVPINVEVEPVPVAIAKKVRWNERDRKLEVNGLLDENEVLAVQKLVADDEVKAEIAAKCQKTATEKPQVKTPAEEGIKVRVPRLSLLTMLNGVEKQVPFIDAAGQFHPVLEIRLEDVEPTENDLSVLTVDRGSSGKIDVDGHGKIVSDFMKEVQLSLDLTYAPENWDEVKLATWLCRQIDTPWMGHELKMSFVQAWLANLVGKHNFELSRTIRYKSVIRSLMEARLQNLRRKAVNTAGQLALFTPEGKQKLRVDSACVFEFSANAYYPASVYAPEKSQWGAHHFKKHYFPVIGDFDSKEEFECARFIDNEAIKGNIKFWIRNLVKTQNSFCLTKIDGHFYPDFVCVLPDEKILVVEYKGADRWDNEKVRSDRAIGDLWAELSDGKCKFVMVRNKEWDKIASMI